MFSPDGELITSWGEVGVGPGEFHLPHGIAVGPDDRVHVCDRENDRIQVFDPDGRYLTEWTDVQRPCHIAIDPDGYSYVAELWRPKGKGSFTHGFMREDHPGRVTIFDRDGAIVARWGASTVSRTAPGNFIAPHGIAVDSRGDLYVCEVSYTFGAKAERRRPGRGRRPPDPEVHPAHGDLTETAGTKGRAHMRHSTDRIRSTHGGNLPRPADVRRAAAAGPGRDGRGRGGAAGRGAVGGGHPA